MKHCTKPPVRKNPNAAVVIKHTGTNDLSRNSTPTEIATNTLDLAADVKKNLNRSCDVIISSIISSFQEVTSCNRKHSMSIKN